MEVLILDGLTATVKRLLSLILNLMSSPAAKAVATFVVIVPLFVIVGESKVVELKLNSCWCGTN